MLTKHDSAHVTFQHVRSPCPKFRQSSQDILAPRHHTVGVTGCQRMVRCNKGGSGTVEQVPAVVLRVTWLSVGVWSTAPPLTDGDKERSQCVSVAPSVDAHLFA